MTIFLVIRVPQVVATCLFAAFATFAGTAFAQPADGKPQSLPVTTIKVGSHPVAAEVADTVQTRAIGLMYRFSLPADRGMLFVFARSEPQGFWMRNTYIPLSIAFIDAGGRILNVEDMAPRVESIYPSRGAALYALEMRRGWFAERNLGQGTQVSGLPPAAKE